MNRHYLELKDGLSALDDYEMQEINGGTSLWETLGYIAGQTVRCFEEFTRTAAEYQASLPATLKK